MKTERNKKINFVHLLLGFIIYFLFVVLIAGCAGHIMTVDKSIQQKWLPFIEDGKTTKEEVILKLGIPSAQFEGERILTYQMTFDEKEGFRVISRRAFEYNLVLVFNERNILQKHRLLKVKP